MFRHWLEMYGASCFVVCYNWGWHVQELWHGRVEFPHKINVAWNAHDITLNFCRLSSSNVVCLNLTRTTNRSDCEWKVELNKKFCMHMHVSVICHKFLPHLHWISSKTELLSPSPSEFVQMHRYWPIWLRLTLVITKLWFEIIMPSLNELEMSRPCTYSRYKLNAVELFNE